METATQTQPASATDIWHAAGRYTANSALAAAGDYLLSMSISLPAMEISAKTLGAAALAAGVVRLSLQIRSDLPALRGGHEVPERLSAASVSEVAIELSRAG